MPLIELTPEQLKSRSQKAALTRMVRTVEAQVTNWTEKYGALTERDFRLIAEVGKSAYMRGYLAGYHKQRAKGRERSAQ